MALTTIPVPASVDWAKNPLSASASLLWREPQVDHCMLIGCRQCQAKIDEELPNSVTLRGRVGRPHVQQLNYGERDFELHRNRKQACRRAACAVVYEHSKAIGYPLPGYRQSMCRAELHAILTAVHSWLQTRGGVKAAKRVRKVQFIKMKKKLQAAVHELCWIRAHQPDSSTGATAGSQ
eukprot:5057107-Amphidinium_carterae.1